MKPIISGKVNRVLLVNDDGIDAPGFLVLKKIAQDISNEMTGIIVGSGGPSTQNLLKSFDLAKNGGSRKVGPFMVPRSMSSTNSATLATPFKIKGVNYSIT